MHCAVIGLGEAGRIYAEALVAAGHRVTGFDPVAEPPPGVVGAPSAREAAVGAEAVLVLTAARLSAGIAEDLAPVLGPEVTYVDMTSASPQQMRALGDRLADAGIAAVDCAILGPVPLQGASTPLMLSGPGARSAETCFASIGAPVEVVDGPPGQAMAHKLLRSVFTKGLASVVCEAARAGRAAGLEEWITRQMAAQLAGDGQAVVRRFLVGTPKHALRRSEEMRAARAYLEELGATHDMTDATVALHERYAAEGAS